MMVWKYIISVEGMSTSGSSVFVPHGCMVKALPQAVCLRCLCSVHLVDVDLCA